MEDGADSWSRAECTVSRLESAGVLQSEGDDEVRLTDDFASQIQAYRELVSQSDDWSEKVRTLFANRVVDPQNFSYSEEFAEVIVEYLALRDIDDLSEEDRVSALIALDSIRRSPPPDDGAPAPFIPVRGECASFLVNLFECSVIYVWKEDCPPCELLRQELEELFEEPPQDVAFFAVYGPDFARLLYERFQVDGAPTTLFLLNGTVDARLRGAYQPNLYRREVEKIQEASQGNVR